MRLVGPVDLYPFQVRTALAAAVEKEDQGEVLRTSIVAFRVVDQVVHGIPAQVDAPGLKLGGKAD